MSDSISLGIGWSNVVREGIDGHVEMSYPMTDTCAYCDSPDVMDDAWWCEKSECWEAYDAEEDERMRYEDRTPLTMHKAVLDLSQTGASVWGLPWIAIKNASEGLARLAKLAVH